MDFVWLRVSELFLPSVSYNLIFFCSFSWLWQTKFRLSLSLSGARIAKEGWAAHKKRWSARIKSLHLALEILDSSIDLIAFSALSFGAEYACPNLFIFNHSSSCEEAKAMCFHLRDLVFVKRAIFAAEMQILNRIKRTIKRASKQFWSN